MVLAKINHRINKLNRMLLLKAIWKSYTTRVRFRGRWQCESEHHFCETHTFTDKSCNWTFFLYSSDQRYWSTSESETASVDKAPSTNTRGTDNEHTESALLTRIPNHLELEQSEEAESNIRNSFQNSTIGSKAEPFCIAFIGNQQNSGSKLRISLLVQSEDLLIRRQQDRGDVLSSVITFRCWMNELAAYMQRQFELIFFFL